MKSISPKQAPQMSPCLPMRARQTMQTGGRRRSASGERIDLSDTAKERPFVASTGPGAIAVSASLIDMAVMIKRNPAGLEEPMDRAS